MVERTAHNSLVVGSIPTKLNTMKFYFQDYKNNKIKNYIKKNKLFFFVNCTDRNSNDFLELNQELKKTKFNYYKVFNTTAKKILKKCIYNVTNSTINGITFFIKPENNKLIKRNFINNFDNLLLNILVVKINLKAYTNKQIKNNISYNYINTKLFYFQLINTHIKKKSK